MFGTILTVIFALLLGYVLWRVGTVPWVARHATPKRLLATGAVLWLLFFLGRFVGHDGTGPVAAALELVGMSLLGWVFLTFLPLLVVDLVTLFGRLLQRWAPGARLGALCVGTVLATIALVQGFRAPAVVAHAVTLPGLPAELDGTTIVAASDAHVGTQLGAAWLAERAQQIRTLEPDAVVFLGDIFEGHGDAPPDLSSLRALSPRLGKWYVTGNHDSDRRRGGSRARWLEQVGFRRLAGESAVLAPGLVIAGVDDLTHHRRRRIAGDPLAEALAERPPGATILLSHTPWRADQAARAGARLMLSGHTHGGQIWPFGYLVQTVYPLLAGRYCVTGMRVIVSRGMGTWGPRMRLWHRGEILQIVLRAPRDARQRACP